MEIVKSGISEVIFNQSGAMGRKLAVNNGCEYVYLTIERNAGIAPHALPIPVTFFVVAGVGEVSADGHSFSVEKNDCFTVAPGVVREWKNRSDTLVELLVIKHLPEAQ